MQSKIFMSIFVSLVLSSTAHADSFCGFDMGLVGTKAIGFVHPVNLDMHKYETGICEINVFDSTSELASKSSYKCTDFQHIPSRYIDAYQEEEGFDPIASDYFYLQVLDAKDNWAQLVLKTGETKWVKKAGLGNFDFPYQFKANEAPVSINMPYPTQSGVYSEPRFDKPDRYHGSYMRDLTDGWIDSQVNLDFFNSEIFKLMEKHGLFNASHMEEGKLATNYGEFLHISYDVSNIIRDEEGREWLKAKEVLELSYHNLGNFIHSKLNEQDANISSDVESNVHDIFWDHARSKPGRTVYFPYRDPSGTITMVMHDGPNCGC